MVPWRHALVALSSAAPSLMVYPQSDPECFQMWQCKVSCSIVKNNCFRGQLKA